MPENTQNSNPVHDLNRIARIEIRDCDFAMIGPQTRVTALVYQKQGRTTDFGADVLTACNSLKQLGFKEAPRGGANFALATASTVISYKSKVEPYTIYHADFGELTALQKIMNGCTDVKVKITRADKKYTKVPVREFKQAIDNFLKQNQK